MEISVLLCRETTKIDNNFKIHTEMKKVMFLMAVAGMFAFAACNNNAEEAVEEPVAEEMVEEAVEEAIDTTVEAVEAAAEEVVAE